MTREPLFDLVTKAQTLASTLADMGMAHNAEVVRELCRRVVPVKIVASRGKGTQTIPLAMPEVQAPAPKKVWCDQCDALVERGCSSRFCKVAA